MIVAERDLSNAACGRTGCRRLATADLPLAHAVRAPSVSCTLPRRTCWGAVDEPVPACKSQARTHTFVASLPLGSSFPRESTTDPECGRRTGKRQRTLRPRLSFALSCSRLLSVVLAASLERPMLAAGNQAIPNSCSLHMPESYSQRPRPASQLLQSCRKVLEQASNGAQICHFGPPFRPIWAGLGQTLTDFDQISADVGHMFRDFSQIWPTLGQMSDFCRPQPNFGLN